MWLEVRYDDLSFFWIRLAQLLQDVDQLNLQYLAVLGLVMLLDDLGQVDLKLIHPQF